jgi:hydrophobe/amphiphile efflux-1 (HAE1) family protein
VNLSAPFIRHPVATTLLATAIFLCGTAGFLQLPVAPLPRVDFPTLSVSAQLPGASPATMASAVATPLERRFGRIAGLSELTSSSSLGSTSVTMQFDLDRDVDSAARDVQAAINAASADLPSNLPTRPTWRKVNPADAPILILSLTSEAVPLDKMFDVANTVFAQKIAQVSGVGQVFVGGGQQPAVRVRIDPDALSGAGYTLEDVRGVLSSATANEPKGTVSGGQQSLSIAADDQLFGAQRWRTQIIGVSDGGTLRLEDVAQVFDDVENQRAAAWINGTRCVLLIIRKQPGANIIATIERVKAIMPGLVSSISPALKVDVALDRSTGVRSSVRDVERTLILSVLLVIAVVFIFLHSARATAIPAVVVPLSLVGTFALMWLLDYSLDILSLMALTISTGFVVDDAIVVTENISRVLEAGESPLEAALKGARQIGFTVLSITVSLLAVFIPLFLMSGIVGRLLHEFVVTLAIAIGISGLLSVTLTPMMCSRLLTRARAPGRVASLWARGFERVVTLYERALRQVLRHRGAMLGVTGAAVVLTVILFWVMPKGLFPQQDTGLLLGVTEGPQDVAFLDMRRRQETVNALIRSDPEVVSAVAFIGAGPGGGSTNTGSIFVVLRPRPERETPADQIIARLRPKLGRLPGTNVFLQPMQDIRVGGRSSRSQYQYTLQAATLPELLEASPRVVDALKEIPGLRDVTSDQQSAGLQLSLQLDRDTASRLGITPRVIDDTLYDAFGQRQVATSFTQLNQYRVVMEVDPRLAADASGLSHLFIRSGSGGLVPLEGLVSVSEGTLPLSVNHQGQFAAVTISFNLAPGVSLSEATAAVDLAVARLNLPPGMRGSFQGTAQVFAASRSSQVLLILAALLAVYVVLGILYESYVHPLTILSTLPPAGVGGLLSLMLFKLELSVVGLVALILLIGIVKKNAIMMVDFAIDAERNEGLSPLEAIVKAGRLRFRPILMTTLSAMLGGLPLALGHGQGSELRQPLGIAIVGGLLVSQWVTMFSTPVVYVTLDRFSRRRGHQTLPEQPVSPLV